MFRIAFIAPFGLGQKTTVWARTLPLARFLAARGHAVTLIIPPWDTPADAGKAWLDQGVQVVNVALAGGIPVTVARMARHLDRFQPQIVHIIKPRAHAGLVQYLLWQRRWIKLWSQRWIKLWSQRWIKLWPQRQLHKQGPYLFLDVDDWEQAWASINHYHPFVARFLAWQEEWGIRHADGITAASHWLVDRVQDYAPATPVRYLPNGVAAQVQWRVPRAECEVAAVTSLPAQTLQASEQVLFVSRYVEVAPDWLAAFWCALAQARIGVQLTVFGDPFDAGRRALFQQAMASLCPQAAARVRWLAYDKTVAQQLYAECTCAIFPSNKTPLHEAKCSVRLATTLLQGVPVVASAVGEQAYYGAAGAAHLVPPAATPGEFATAVAQVLADPAQQAALRHQGRQRLVETYDWVKLGTQLEAFYGEIVTIT